MMPPPQPHLQSHHHNDPETNILMRDTNTMTIPPPHTRTQHDCNRSERVGRPVQIECCGTAGAEEEDAEGVEDEEGGDHEEAVEVPD